MEVCCDFPVNFLINKLCGVTYPLLISDKQLDQYSTQDGVAQKEKTTHKDGLFESENCLAGVRGSRTSWHLEY